MAGEDGSSPTARSSSAARPRGVELDGIAGSAGVTVGRAVVIDAPESSVVRRRITEQQGEEELERFRRAVTSASRALRDVAERIRESATRAESSIVEAYILMLEDETLRDAVERRILGECQCVEWAVDGAVRAMAEQLRAAHDPYLAERSHDFEFIGERILRQLAGRQRTLSLVDLEEPGILVAHDLSPAETAGLNRERVGAMVMEVGTRTSHTAILARALEIPAVVGVRELLTQVATGDRLLVDALRGRVIVEPTDEQIAAATARAERYRAVAERSRALQRPAATRCGVRVALRGNVELPAEAGIASALGAEGIGLYRTEFLYVDRADPPGEEAQFETYRRVLEVMSPMPVTLRTFDIGGDKYVSAFPAPAEMNPALGLRAVRLGLARPELFLTQLRAMVRASAHGSLSIMVPMIASVRELREVRSLLEQARREVDGAGHPSAREIPLGVMIEVPSAAVMAAELAREAAFMSIGTNDLVQYALAVDRTSRELAYLATPFDPAILRLIHGVVAAGRLHDRPVSVCGAMASDPLAAVLLVGMGLRELSMEASAIPGIKEALGRVTLAEAEAVVAAARPLVTAAEIEALVIERLGPLLSDLLELDAAGS